MDEGLRLHLALCTVAERLADVMEDARFERRDGYAFVTFPTLPIPSFNGVWPDEDSAATALPDALAEIGSLGCRFLVAGRMDGSGTFLELRDLPVPSMSADLFTAIPRSLFQLDISSTQIRALLGKS